MKKTSFKLLKEELNEKAKAHTNESCGAYRKFLNASTESELLNVIHENLNWCITHKVLSHEYFAKFNQELYLASGIANTGLENPVFSNSGNWNSGDWNSGDRNSGDSNSGDRNSGYRNSGNWNSGDRNSGDSNSGYRNSGAFCTDKDPIMYLFDKPTSMTVKKWEQTKAVSVMYNIDTTLWIPSYKMTDQEKKDHPKHETTDGYLKTIPMKEAWKNAWHNFTEETKSLFINLENFNADKFEKITGIRV